MAAISLLLLGSSPATALTELTNPSQFSASSSVEDFEGLGLSVGDPVLSLGDISFLLSSGGGAIFRLDSAAREFSPAGAGSIDNGSLVAAPFPLIRFTFADPIFRFGFELRSVFGEDIDVTAKLVGGTLADITLASRATTVQNPFFFYGIEDDTGTGFTEIVVSSRNDGLIRFDNLRTDPAPNPVPEPSTAVLTGLGLLLLATKRRRS